MRLTNNTIHSISKSSNIRMGLSYAKESHAEFFNRFSLCQDRIKDIFEIELKRRLLKEIFPLLQAVKIMRICTMKVTDLKDVLLLVLLVQIPGL